MFIVSLGVGEWFITFLILLCLACGNSSPKSDDGGTLSLSEVNDYAYWLNGPDLDQLGESAYDLLVIDYSSDGSEEGAFSAGEIETLKNSSGGPKIVLAYMSIGEAENYRFYFDPTAGYLDAENPDWPGNFKVHYWESDWQEVIFDYTDQLIAAGFDGIYLDIIDAYEYYGPGGESGMERGSAGEEMIDFVLAIAERARNENPDFLVFPQNAVAILDEPGGNDYLETVDGVGTESTFYFGEKDGDNDLDLENAAQVTPYLDRFVSAGKVVLSVDYVQDPDKVADFYERAGARGYIPYASVRELDRLIVNEGFEPD